VHVLIIEDEALLALDLQCFLEELGADSCSLAETEHEAVQLALNRPPDLITADVNLRDGTGPAAVDAIRSSIGPVPVVYITGSKAEDIAVDDRTHLVKKPILWLELVEAVEPFDLPRQIAH